MADFSSSMSTVLCCMCGVVINQNPANMCLTCVREHIDITEGINRSLTIHSCRGCNRWLCPPWQTMALESKELMATCLRKINGLKQVKLIDAIWIWTEPHSMRLKIKITIQKEVLNGAVLQQAALVEFTIRNQQCNHCQASYAQGAWQAVVAVRQRVPHKRTFFFLEQLLLKHNAHSECINIITFKDGMDFYFTEKQYALRFSDFLASHVPTKTKYTRKLISADHKSNIGKFKHNFIVEIVPLCKDDLVILPKPLASNLSDISPLVLVKAVSAGVHVVDPLTGERQEIDVEKYWRYEFPASLSSKALVRFVVLSLEPMLTTSRPSAKKRGIDRKIRMAECIVVRERDFGVTDTQYSCVTHLGHILKEGDIVLGYDLAISASFLEEGAGDSLKADFPDVVLVRKVYPSKGDRVWELRALETEDARREVSSREQAAVEEDYEQFLQEIEGDKEMRSGINLYRSKGRSAKASAALRASKKAAAAQAAAAAGGEEEGSKMDAEANAEDDDDEELDEEQVRLDELLDELTITGEPASATGGMVASTDEALPGTILLTAEEASQVPTLDIGSSGFDAADFDASKFKF